MTCKLKPRKQIRTMETVGKAEKGKGQSSLCAAKLCEELNVALARKRKDVI